MRRHLSTETIQNLAAWSNTRKLNDYVSIADWSRFFTLVVIWKRWSCEDSCGFNKEMGWKVKIQRQGSDIEVIGKRKGELKSMLMKNLKFCQPSKIKKNIYFFLSSALSLFSLISKKMFKKLWSTWRSSRSSMSQGGRSFELLHVFSSCISLGTCCSRRHWVLFYTPGSASKKPPSNSIFRFLPTLMWPLLGEMEPTGLSLRVHTSPAQARV